MVWSCPPQADSVCMGVCETGSRLNCMALVPTAATTGTGRGSFVILEHFESIEKVKTSGTSSWAGVIDVLVVASLSIQSPAVSLWKLLMIGGKEDKRTQEVP